MESARFEAVTEARRAENNSLFGGEQFSCRIEVEWSLFHATCAKVFNSFVEKYVEIEVRTAKTGRKSSAKCILHYDCASRSRALYFSAAGRKKFRHYLRSKVFSLRRTTRSAGTSERLL